MEIIVTNKGGGKTKQLIELAAKDRSYIVCHSLKECNRIHREAIENGIDINFPITYNEFVNRLYHGPGIKGFYIDNIEMLLEYLSCGVEVRGFTATHELKQRT